MMRLLYPPNAVVQAFPRRTCLPQRQVSVAPFDRNVAATGGSQAELEHEIDQTIEEVGPGRP